MPPVIIVVHEPTMITGKDRPEIFFLLLRHPNIPVKSKI